MTAPLLLARWRQDPVAFITEMLVDPETGAPFDLNHAEITFLAHAFKTAPDGRPRYSELVFSCPKKSGKSTFAAMITLYIIVVLAGRGGEGYTLANDFEQAQGRVFAAIARIVEASPLLAQAAKVTASKITFSTLGASITALANDASGAAGSNPHITVFDELWGYVSERSRRLWDESPPVPTRKWSQRLVVTYAGYEGESALLEDIYNRGIKGRVIGRDLYAAGHSLMFWSHRPISPLQTEAWVEQMRETMRPNAFLRQIENRFVTSESTFLDLAWWDACVDPSLTPIVADPRLPIWVGVDASVRGDSTALVAVTWDREANKVRQVTHRIFQPTASSPLDFEATIEATLLDWMGRFRVKEVRFDPYQMQSVAQRLLTRHRVPMVEFPQTVPGLTESSTNLYELIKGRNLVAYRDAAIRLAVQRAVAVETSRGWRIAKEKASHRIDVVVALGMAALGAVQGGITRPPMEITEAVLARASMPDGYSRDQFNQVHGASSMRDLIQQGRI